MTRNRLAAATALALRIGVGLGIGTAFVSVPVAHAAKAAAAASVSISADVSGAGQVAAAAGDKLYAAKDFAGALAAYGQGFAKTRDAAFIYAEAQCHAALAHKDDAEVMFKMYLSAAGKAKLKYEAEAKAALGGAKNTAKKVLGAVGGLVKDTATAVADLGLTVAGGVYTVAKVTVAESVSAAAKAKATAGDAAYAGAKYAEAAKEYGAAFAASQEAIALYAMGQAAAQAGNAVEARAALNGYLAAGAPGKHAEEAKQLLLAIGGATAHAVKIDVKANVSAKVAADAEAADALYASGKFLDAAKAYGAASAKAAGEAALLYGQGMAEYSAGQMAEAKTHLEAAIKAGLKGNLKVHAEATVKASSNVG